MVRFERVDSEAPVEILYPRLPVLRPMPPWEAQHHLAAFIAGEGARRWGANGKGEMLGLADKLAPQCGTSTLASVTTLAVDKDGPLVVIKQAEQTFLIGGRVVGVGPKHLLPVATRLHISPGLNDVCVVSKPGLVQCLAHVVERMAVRGRLAEVVQVH